MKTVYITVLSLFLASVLTAQQNLIDEVHLKNGSIVRGTIKEMVLDSIVKIESNDGNLWVFPVRDVERLAKVEDTNARGMVNLTKGYMAVMDVGVLQSKKSNPNSAPFSFSFVNSYFFQKGFAMGAAVGIETYSDMYMPVAVDFRLFRNKKYHKPFLYVQYGYQVPLNGEKKEFNSYPYYYSYYLRPQGGILFNPGIGITLPLAKKTFLNLSISYRYQEFKFKSKEESTGEYLRTEKENRLGLRIGFVFN